MDRKNKRNKERTKKNTWTSMLRRNDNRQEGMNKRKKKTRAHSVWMLLFEHVSLN